MAEDWMSRDAQFSARFWAAVSGQPVVLSYAQALVNAAQGAGQLDSVLEQFDSLINDVFAQFPKLEQILYSALVSAEEKKGILDRVFKGASLPIFLNFLKVLVQHGRMELVREIWQKTRELADKLHGRVRVELRTATAPELEWIERFVGIIRPMVGGEPIVELRVDPELIGGFVVRLDDKLLDASVARQLSRIRQQLLSRSIHAIQSRRDRFSYPAGN